MEEALRLSGHSVRVEAHLASILQELAYCCTRTRSVNLKESYGVLFRNTTYNLKEGLPTMDTFNSAKLLVVDISSLLLMGPLANKIRI